MRGRGWALVAVAGVLIAAGAVAVVRANAAADPPGTYEWDMPEQLWPALAPFSPAQPHWLHSRAHASTNFQHAKWGDLYLDPAAGLAFFVLLDH